MVILGESQVALGVMRALQEKPREPAELPAEIEVETCEQYLCADKSATKVLQRN